jgi:hypothetical protein
LPEKVAPAAPIVSLVVSAVLAISIAPALAIAPSTVRPVLSAILSPF